MTDARLQDIKQQRESLSLAAGQTFDAYDELLAELDRLRALLKEKEAEIRRLDMDSAALAILLAGR